MKLMLAATLVAACALCALGQGTPGQTLFRTHDQECACDPALPESMRARECSLCREADLQPVDALYFFLKDANPRKPNRWLILPRGHKPGMHDLQLGEDENRIFWQAAVDKASSMWGTNWGLAVNGDRSRTQCHAHVHMGKLVGDAEGDDYLFRLGASPVAGKPVLSLHDVSEIRVPRGGEGFWIHPVGPDLHLHVEDTAAASEFVLLR